MQPQRSPSNPPPPPPIYQGVGPVCTPSSYNLLFILVAGVDKLAGGMDQLGPKASALLMDAAGTDKVADTLGGEGSLHSVAAWF